MYCIPQDHADYILSKYHDRSKPFHSLARFLRRDELFSPDTGMDPNEMENGIWENDRLYSQAPHTVRKARAFAYVLDNTRIACDPRDRFPAINSIDRPIQKTLVQRWSREVFEERIPQVRERMTALDRAGAVRILPDYDHSVPVWDRIFSLGFPGLMREADEARERLRARRSLTRKEAAFYESIDITYEALLRFCARLSNLARRSNHPRLAEALKAISQDRPQTFYQALLTIYLYHIVSEHIDSLQVRSLSNFDRLLFPFYSSDLHNGETEETLREDLAYFLLQYTAIGNYWNQPVFLGGVKADGSTEINGLSYLFLDVYDKLGIYNPKVQIKLAGNTPQPFVRKALDMIRRGHNSIVFVVEETISAALQKQGVPAEAARTCNITGCYEYSPQDCFCTGMNYFNLMKPLEYAIYGGRDGVTGIQAGLPTPVEFSTFEEFYSAYLQQLYHLVDACIETVNGFEGYLSQINPLPLLGATFPSCIEQGEDPIHGGSAFNFTSLAFGFLANAADSLASIRRLVFEEKELTLTELGEILRQNFKGHELLRQRMLRSPEHFGNNRPVPDEIARRIVSSLASYINGRPTARNGLWTLGFHVARMSYEQGAVTAASADGRLRGDELSKNVSASLGSSRSGATAAILSTVKLDATEFAGDAPLDLGLHTSAVQGESGLEAIEALLRTFAEGGGHAIHFNVFSAEVLRDAQIHPEKYPDLQIRVCGWNVLFNQIAPQEQEGFIRQAEALA